MSDAQSWAKSLSSEIDSGTYASDKDGWLDGIDLSDPQTTAMGWATDSNAYVCSTVMPNGTSAVESGDLDGSYYDSAIPIIELQIARGELSSGGVRFSTDRFWQLGIDLQLG